MPVTTNVEYEKRIRAVQDWLIEDWPDTDIIAACISKWQVSKRQSQRYIKEANDRWVEQNERKLSVKRATRVQAVKKLLKKLPESVLSTPAGVNSAIRAHKFIAKLEGVEPTRQQIDAEIAKDQGKQADPLAPTTSTLQIIALPEYDGPETFKTANPEPKL